MNKCQAHFVNLLLRPSFLFQFRDWLRFLVLVTKVGIVKLKEYPLGPADIFWISRIDLPIPVVSKAQLLQLATKVVDIGLRGNARVLPCFDGVLLSRQTKGIPTHRV